MVTGSTNLRPRARIIGLIGDELISDEPVAVVELVKNSYDADATTVEVKFEGDPKNPNRIVISDDGTGMNLDTVLNAWLEPGTVNKKRQERSPGNRPYLGAKGIGRFAAARLGERLLMETRQKGSDEVVLVCLEWGNFEDDSKYLDSISVDYDVQKTKLPGHGTKLTIEGLKKPWTADACEQLHARLSRLISPFKEVRDFEIALDIPGRRDLSGPVEPPDLLLRPKYQLSGRLGSGGAFEGLIKIDGKTCKALTQKLVGPKGAKPICGPFDLDIRAWDRDREGLEPIAKKEGISVAQVRGTLNAFCGVSIYRDGFRVHPYGESGNDWLDLDLRSRQVPVRNLANNQMIASIGISRDGNPGLRDRSTREGMIKNREHEELEIWFIRILSLLEEARYEVRPRRKSAVEIQPLFEAFDLAESVREVTAQLGVAHPVARLMKRTQQRVSAGADRLQEVFSQLLMSSGLGHMVDIVIHEIGAPLGKLNRQLSALERELSRRLDEDGRKVAGPMIEAMRAWLEQIHSLRQRLDPQTPAKRGRATLFDVTEEVELTFDLYEALLRRQNIQVTIKKPKAKLEVRMPRAVLSQIMANLVDNAIYWLSQSKGPGKGGRIHAAVTRTKEGFVVRVSDDGPGVPETSRELIFEPYYSTKPSGIGLGLYIARLVIEPYGRLLYSTECDLPGACFEARFEKGVGS